MGYIEIRQRQQGMGSLGPVQRVDADNGAAAAFAANARLGREMLDLGIQGMRFAAHLRDENDRKVADEFAARYRKAMMDYNDGSVSPDGGTRTPGTMEAKIEDAPDGSAKWMDGNERFRKETAASLRRDLKMNDRQFRLAGRMLEGFNLSLDSRWANRAASVERSREVGSAKANFDLAEFNMSEPGASGATAREWKDAMERYLELQPDLSGDQKAALRRQSALRIVKRGVEGMVCDIRERAELAETETDGANLFDGEIRKLNEAAKDGLALDALVPEWAEIKSAGDEGSAPGANPMREALAGVDGSGIVKAAAEDLRRQKERWLSDRRARTEAEEREYLNGLSLKAREAMATGGIGVLEKAYDAMEAETVRWPKGSRRHVVALELKKRLDAAADAEAKRSTWDALVESGGKADKPKAARAAKFYPALKASYDEQYAQYVAGAFAAEDAARNAERTSNEAALKARMLAAAKLDPGGFSAQLADAAEKGHISIDQYRRLRDEFAQTWRKEGMPEKAAALVDALKKEFFAGKDYDLNARLGVNPKTGKFEYGKDPATKKPFEGEDVEFETAMLVKGQEADRWTRAFNPEYAEFFSKDRVRLVTNTLTSAEQIQLLNWALELAQHDGEWISTDPLTGERLEKPRPLNAVQEFQNLCSSMKTRKGVNAAQETISARAEAQLNLNAAFAGADAATVAKAAKRAADETKDRKAARQMRRAPFAPKMPGSGLPRRGTPDAAENDSTEN